MGHSSDSLQQWKMLSPTLLVHTTICGRELGIPFALS